jgi:hypothetical protein
MRKLALGTVAALALIAAAPAGADPGDNNGCGEVFRLGAAPGFGQTVSDAAQAGGFDEDVRLICRQIGSP